MTFTEGDRVRKRSGYNFDGTVVAAFHKLDGQERYVVEMDGNAGLLHIFNAGQLERREVSGKTGELGSSNLERREA